jgi:hypothetical protein
MKNLWSTWGIYRRTDQFAPLKYGSGFPNGIGREDLSPLTRIVMVADH